MITVITPFKRTENLSFLVKALEGKCNWVVLIDDQALTSIFPSWVTVRKFDSPTGDNKSNRLINEFIATTKLDPEGQYMILNDDDSVEDGFFDKIPNEEVVIVSMKRGDNCRPNLHYGAPVDLIAKPENLKIAFVGGEQCILKGRILKCFRYGLSPIGDGEMVIKVCEEYTPVFVPDAYVLFNYFEDGRFSSFRRKPLVLFVGDFFCAANPRMGKSEWEGNIAASLDATGYADVATFHMDKYYYITGRKGDLVLLQRIEELKPDYIVLILYKHLGSDPTVLHKGTLEQITIPIISIWGDLEDETQRDVALTIKPYAWKMIGTANREISESIGYTYLHVPKDPRIFNNPGYERDIEVLFNGSFGYGREERQKVIQYLSLKGVNIIAGGSEGKDHFTTEEYANRYKRAKIALSFSQARGVNVVNARVFEAMACGSLLLEQDSKELQNLYVPYKDYVPWTDEIDLLTKIRYYLEHAEERLLIASSGCKKTHELYSAKTFWSKVLER